jgi:DNA repair protein RadC
MKQLNLFENVIAEVEMSYSHKIKQSDLFKVTSSNDIVAYLRDHWKNIDYTESFKAIYLSRANKVLGIHLISQGGISGTVVDVRLILQAALLSCSSSIILAHNHPSGTMQASQADIQITRKIKDAAALMDITVLDHIILSSEHYYSLADEGEL